MEYVVLTSEDRDILLQRGFFVKSTYSVGQFFNIFLRLWAWFGLIIFISFIILISSWDSSNNIFSDGIKSGAYWLASYILIPIVVIIYVFIFSDSWMFLLSNWKQFFYYKDEKIHTVWRDQSFIEEIFAENPSIMSMGIFGVVPIIAFPVQSLLFLLGIILSLLLIHSIDRIFYPLYAFWNLWDKIQKLAPEIQAQRQILQNEFEKSQNFSVLHKGFDTFASTFEKIITLVLKLETVEQRANKWNLFDSAKYINSLRQDILTPLISLKKFLEEKRQQLAESQQELTRVMVGESSELTGNTELATIRWTELLNELDNNITQLDEMIAKMG